MQPHFARPLATRLHPRAIPLLEKSGGIAVFLEGKTTPRPRLAINNLVSKFQQQTSKPHDLCLKNHLPLYFLNHLLIHSSQFPHFLLQIASSINGGSGPNLEKKNGSNIPPVLPRVTRNAKLASVKSIDEPPPVSDRNPSLEPSMKKNYDPTRFCDCPHQWSIISASIFGVEWQLAISVRPGGVLSLTYCRGKVSSKLSLTVSGMNDGGLLALLGRYHSIIILLIPIGFLSRYSLILSSTIARGLSISPMPSVFASFDVLVIHDGPRCLTGPHPFLSYQSAVRPSRVFRRLFRASTVFRIFLKLRGISTRPPVPVAPVLVGSLTAMSFRRACPVLSLRGYLDAPLYTSLLSGAQTAFRQSIADDLHQKLARSASLPDTVLAVVSSRDRVSSRGFYPLTAAPCRLAVAFFPCLRIAPAP
nr:hypothetical protein Iba_chr04eCG16680 [Ipomoea batatas]